MTSERVSVKRVTMLAGAYVACAIGSGYATGQEIMQFFSGHGLMSIVGVVITTALFSWCGGMFMRHGYERQMSEPEEVMAFYFGEKLAKPFEILFQTFLYGVYVVMIAGAGDTLAEYFGLNSMAGRLGMAIVSFITVIAGLSKLTDILGGLGTAIIVFALGIGVASFATNPDGILTANTVIPTLEMSRTNCGWFWSSILYPGYNAVAVVIISCLMGKNANSSKEAYYGGILGGILFGVAIMMMNLGILANIKEVYDKAVPTLVLADRINPVLGLLFSIIICCGIYTTAVPMLWGVSRNFAVDGSKRFVLIALLLTVLGLALGMTSFRSLVGIIYPFSGYIGVILFVFVAYRELFTIKTRRNTDAQIDRIA